MVFNQAQQSFRRTGVSRLVFKAFPLMLLRGTEMERDKRKWNLEESNDDIPVVISSDSFSSQDWLQMREMANQLSPSPFLRGAV